MVFSFPSFTPLKIHPMFVFPTVLGPRLAGSGNNAFKNWIGTISFPSKLIGTMMVVEGLWKKPGVFNVEEFDPDPYMEALNKWGLPWVVCENPQEVE